MSVFTLTAGIDNFTGNAGETNTVFLTPTTLQSTDTITGGATGSFFDILTITAGGTIAAAQFAGVTRFELLNLASAGNSVALTNGLVADSSAGIFSVVGAAGNDTVDASAVNNGMRIAFYAVSGTDSFIGGNGNDYVEFATAELSAADSVNGGNGFDFLAFSTGGTVNAAALANITSIEELLLSNAGNSVALSNAFVAGADNGVMSIVDGTGNDTVDASGISNGTRVAFYTSTGNETFIGGNGSDYLSFLADQLTSGDQVTGGANFDIIEFASAGTVAAGAFNNVVGIDELILNSGGNSVTLSNTMVAGTDNGVLVVVDNGAGGDTINASAVASNRVVFQSNGGNDSFTGGGGSDVVLFSAAGLTLNDTFTGGTGFDVLQLISAGTVGAAAFTNFTGVDELFLNLSGNNITLNGGVVASSDNQVFVVFDEGSNNIVDGSAATLGGRIVFNNVAGANKTYTGGTGSDFFQFTDANLNNTDTLTGGNGAGTDFLQVKTAASVTAADLANVTQMEVVELLAGGSIVLANTLSNSGSLEVDGTAVVDSIDGSGVTGYNLVIKGNGGADTLKGGSGNDQIFLPDTNFVAIDGNGGFDKIILTSAFNGQTFDLSTQVSKITDTEAIVLDSAAGATVQLTAGDIPQINSSGNLLYIAGSSDDQVDVSGTGWTQLETNHTNANLPGHIFVHYHNTNGSDLYIDTLTPTNINLGGLAAQPDSGTAVEDVVTAPSGNLIANDTYTGGGTLSISAVTGATDGGTTFTIDGTYGRLVVTKATGNYTYTLGVTPAQQTSGQQLASGASPTETFNYTVTDGVLTSSSNLVVTVFGTNDAPTATASVVPNATEDAAYSFNVSTLFTDIDSVPTADTLTYSVAGLPAGLSFTGSTISGTPTNDDVGSYTISVTANDGHSGSLTRTFSFSVANTNDAPVGTAATYTINEDTPLAGTVAGTDVDGDGLTFSLVAGSATNGVATVSSGGAFTFTPTANFSGDATFQFRANDGTVNSAAQTVTIHVTSVNDAPVAAADSLSATQDGGAALGSLLANDSDVEDGTPIPGNVTAFTVAGVGSGTVGTPLALGNGATLTVAANGAVTLTQNNAYDYLGAGDTTQISLTYTVTDSGGASGSSSAVITVTGVNDAPAGADKTVTITEDGAHVFAASDFGFSDVDAGSALAFVKITTLPTDGQLLLNGTPITLAGTNVSAADITNGLLRFVPDANENNGTNPSPDYATFTFQVGDGITFDGSPNLFTVSVTAVNDAPVANADTTFTTPEDTALIINLLANDTDVEDGTPVAIARINGATILVGQTVGVIGGTVTLNVDQTLTFNPALDSTTDAFFTYTAKDSAGVESNQVSVAIDVTPVNDGPTAAPDGFTTPEDTAVTFDVRSNDTDVDSPSLVVTQINGITLNSGNSFTVTLGDGATVKRNGNGTLTYTPALNANIPAGPPAEFSYTVSDGLLTSTATVNVTVTAVNDTPVAVADSLSATQDGAAALGSLLANDSDVEDGTPIPGNVTAFAVAGVGSGTVGTPLALGNGATLTVAANGAVTLTQNNAYDYLGTGETTQISLTYTVTDSGGASDSSSAVITVTGANDAPVVDLNGAGAGIDRADTALYTSGGVAINVAPAIATVTDVDTNISKITLTLTADVGALDGASEGLYLPAGAAAFLTSIGFTVSGEGSASLEIMSNTPGGVSPSVFEGILETVIYRDTDTTFAFNPEDRTIAVTATDGPGLTSTPAALMHIDLAADVTDTTTLNSFVGANRADTIRGASGNDTMEGRGGDDQIYGGTEAGDAGLDTAVFTGNRADYTVTRTGPGVYTVADSVSGRDATDTVHDVETLHFDDVDLLLDAPVQVFDSTGNILLATFQANELDQAVDFADGAAGANIIELRSSASPFTAGTWPVVIDDAVIIKGVGGTAIINADGNSGFVINPSAVNGAGETVRFERLTVDGNGSTAGTTGIKYSGVYASTATALGTIEIDHTTVTDFGSNGIYVNGGGTSLSVTIQDSAFSGSGYNSAGSGGSGDVLFFEFTGNASLNEVDVTGTNGIADNGIQISGFQDGVGPANNVLTNIGNVSFTDVSVTGDYAKNLAYIQGYNDFTNLNFAGGLSLGDAGSSAAWTALFIDGGPLGGSYTLDGAIDGTIDSTLSLAGVTVAGGVFGTSPGFVALGSKQIVVNGTLTDDLITGTLAHEAIIGLTGNDTINPGAGNDLVVYNVGDGQDIVTDTAGIDVLGLVNVVAGGAPSATAAAWNVTNTATTLSVDTDTAATTDEVAATGMDALVVQLGDGGDTVTLDGNLAGTGLASITINGGAAGADGADTIDARTLSSANAITANLGTANDTFRAANVVASDTVNGAGGSGDTADYSAATAAVTINLGLGTASGTSVGSDSITNFENAIGGAGGDSITGTSGINTLTGNAGFDTLIGGGDNDILVGGETGEVYTGASGEGDVAGYSGAITRSMIAEDGFGGWTVTSGGEGTDTLSGVEIVDGAEAGRFLLVGNGGFADFAAAYSEAADGDTIVLAGNANYTAGFAIAKSITISGVNYNVAGTGSRAAESVLTGEWSVNAAAPVVIEGVRFLNDATTTGNGIATLTLASSATVQNSVFFSTELGGAPVSASDDRAIKVTATTGAVSILNNLITGDEIGKFGDASWGRGAITWGGGSTLNVQDNRIEYARTAMELTGSNTLLTLDDNTIFHSGSGLSTTGFSGNVTQITDTQFINVDTDWNDRFNSAANNVTWDFGATGNTSDNWLGILAGRGSDTITGTAGKDAILTNQGNDTVHGEENNDSIFVNANTGTDVVDGGSESAGRDTLIVSNVNISGSNGNALDPGDFGDPATTTSGSPSATPVTFTMTDVADTVTPTDGVNSVRDISITASSGGSTVADEIEDVQFNLGSGGDTVNISGDFTNTSLLPTTIKVNGGNGTDTVDARTLTSAHSIVFNGGGGNDTFYVSGAGGNDTFNGGSGTNTIDYSDVGNGVTVDLSNGAAQNTGDGLDTISNVQNVVGTSFSDTLTGTAGANVITGGGAVDSSSYSGTASTAATFGFDGLGHWTVTIASVTDTLIGVERLTFSDKTVLLVDKSGANVGGFQQVQDAIDFASGGETILIRGGLTYSESHTTASGPAGIYINKAGLTLLGVTTTGALITDAATAQSSGPTIVSAHQNNFGANHWVDVNGDNTTFSGVHLKAGAETDNKVLEFWANNVTVENSFVDAYKTVGPSEVYTFAVAIYINDNGTTATDEVTAYTIDGNILNEGVIVANGVGDPSLGISASQKITDNQFIDTFDLGTGLGRYDTIVINGQVNGIGWLLEPTQTPTITGNTVANNTVPFILRGSDNSAANLPTAAQIAVILANNFDANVSYAYVVDSTTGDLVLASRNDGGGPYRSFAVTNTIDTLNLALDATADNVFGGQRDYIHAGDTIIVQSGMGAPVDSQIMVDNLKVMATANSADLDLTMATNFADGSSIPGGVNTLTLTDYAPGSGANVDVTGNSLTNTITGNSGANTLAGAGGDDTLHGGGGNDALQGGVGVADAGTADKATYDNARSNYTIVTTTGVNAIVTSFTDVTETSVTGVDEGHDALSGIEVLEFSGTTLDLNDPVQLFSGSDLIGTFDTIQAAVDAAVDGNTVRLKALTYNENVTIHGKAITIDGVDDTLAGSVITGQITVDTTLDGLFTIKDVLIDATGHQYGVFASANSTALAGAITLNNVTIEDAEQNGFAYVRAGNGTTPTLGDTIGAISILNSAFSNNATVNTGSGGRGDILLYGYNQDLTITNVVIGSPGAFAQKAIQMRGIEGGDTVNVGPYDPAGDVAINNLTITGGYGQDAIAFYRIANFASFTGANNNVNVTRSVNANPNAGLEPWAVINFDEVGGTIDLSGFFASASNLASPDGIVPAVPSVIATPQGLATGDTFIGTSGMDVLVGRGGSDNLNGGGGNDLLIVNAGDAVAGEIYDGGADTDTLLVTGNANFTGSTLTSIEALTFATGAASTVTLTSNQIGGGNLSPTLAVTGNGTANHIVVNMTGTNVDLSTWTFTNWTDGVDTITINGSAANDLIFGSQRDDIIDPAGATSPPLLLADQYNVIHAGGGNDLMFSGPTPTPPHGFAGNVFDGGTGVDTVDYGNAPGAVAANLAAGRTSNFGNGYGGTDWFTDGHPWDAPGTTTVENLLGSAFGDTLIGNTANNLLSGRAGNDQINGGGGVDQLFGGTGDDTFTHDLVDGGQATVDGGETLETLGDKQIVNGTAAAETWYVNPISGGYLGIDNETGADTAATDANYEVRTIDVEEIEINTGGGGDSVIVTGDLGGTGVATSTVTVNGDAGANILDASGVNGATPVNVKLNGMGGNDTLKGGAGNDTLNGGADSDSITGGAGDDTIIGGDTGVNSDTAVYSQGPTGYTVTFNVGGTVTVDDTFAGDGDEGTDTLSGIEVLNFNGTLIDLSKAVRLYDSGEHLIGAFDTIQAAVDAAAGTVGFDETIRIKDGTYTEQVTINGGAGSLNGLTIEGQSEAGVIIKAPAALVSNGVAPSNGRNVNGLITVDNVDNVTITKLTVDGDNKGNLVVGASNPTMVGIAYLNSDFGVIDDVTVTEIREPDAGFGNQRNLGIFVSNSNPSGATPTTPSIAELAGLNSIEIKNATVTDFQKGGIVVSFANASIHDNVVTGRGLTGLTAQNGIQLAGSTGSVNGNTVTAIGYNNPNVSIGYAILTFNNRDVTIDGNHITGTGVGPTDSSGGIAAIGSTGVVVTNNDIHQVLDAMDVYATASFVDALAPSATSNPGGVFDFSTNAVDADVPFSVFFRPFATSTDAFVVTGTNRDDELHGASVVDTLNGGAGNDFLDGRGGADIIDGGTGNDVILISAPAEFAVGETIEGGLDSDTIRFASTTASDTLTLSSAVTGVENVTISDANGITTGTTALNVDASAVTTALNITGNDGANSLTGTALADTLSGNGGADLLTGGNGADTIHGGSGLDTANYTTAYTGHSVAWNGTTATVTGGTDTGATGDVIDTTGKLQFTDKAVWLVNDEAGSEYSTLAQLFDGNAANGEAANGDIIILDDGTYVGDVTVNKAVTILGANAGIAGTGIRSVESIIEGQLFVTAGATIDGIEVHNTTNNATQFIGVRIQNTAADVTVRNSLFYSTGPNGSAEDRAINMDTTVSGHVTIANNLITGDQTTSFGNSNWHRGIWSDGGTSQLDITGNTLDHVRSGMNLDGLNNATTNVSGNTFLADGTGIAVGGNYVGNPAALSLTAIHDNFFSNTAEDLNVQNFTTDVSFDATATNNAATEAGTPVFFVDGGRATDTLTGTGGSDVLLGHALDGMVGNDSNTLTGKGGADLLIGANGTGTDTAVYAGAITTANITATSAATDTNPFVAGIQPGWTVNGGVAEGTDTLSEIEIVDGAGAGRILLVGNGGYASIAAAVAAAVDGDTILVAPGTYTESVTVDKDVTIAGANHGIAHDGTRSAETILDGGFRITASGVTIDGFQIINGRSDFGQQRSGIFIDGARADVTVANSIIDQVTSHAESFQHGIISTYGANTPNLQVRDNLIQNWNEGTYLNPGVHDSTFDGNAFADNGNHLVFDDPQNLTISNNDFGASLGSKIVPMVYDNPTDLEVELGLAGNTFANDGTFAVTTIPFGPNGQTILGTSVGERITAAFSPNPNFDYVFSGRAGNDTLVGGGGNDTLTGGADNDTINAGAGNDTINYVVGDGNDTVDGGTETTGDTLNISNVGGAAATITITATGADPFTVDFSTTAGTEIAASEIENVNVTTGSNGDTVVVNGDFSATSLSVSTITVTGGAAVDTVNASGLTSTHRVVFTGGANNDVFTGGAGNDTFIAGNADGDDSFTGGGGSDTIDYSAVTSAITADLAAGIATGAGTDTLSGVENVITTAQVDTITVSLAANTVSAGAGNDIILIGSGSHATGDTIDGGGNTDTIRFTSTTASDTLALNANTTGIEQVTIADAAGVTTGTTALNVNVSAVTGAISLTGNDGDNVLTGNGSANTIIGGNGADTIDAGGGGDTVNAGGGNDTVIGTADGVNDTYNGGSGTDTIDYSALGASDSISVNLQTGAASGAAIGSDNLSGSSFENANGGGGNDSLFGNLANNVIHGNGGTDNIVGGGGSDQLFGETGADTLNGGVNDFGVTPAAANDVLWGGADTDTFRFEGRFGDDSIGTAGNADWVDGEDMVFVGYGTQTPTIVDVTDGVLISIDDGSVASSVFVAGATSAQMQQLVSGLDLIIH